MSHLDEIMARMLAGQAANPHIGAHAMARVAADRRLAWLQAQHAAIELPAVSSFADLVELRATPDYWRQARIGHLIAARRNKLQRFPGAVARHMAEARFHREAEVEAREEAAKHIVSVDIDGFGYRVTYSDSSYYKTPVWQREFGPFLTLQAAE